jgi:hypothetical protein
MQRVWCCCSYGLVREEIGMVKSMLLVAKDR